MASQERPSAHSGQAPNPNVAALMTWLVPGGGHFYLGNLRTAAIGFVVIQGLYLLGVILSGGMFLEILPPEMRGRFAAALTPEAGNLGALIVHVKAYGFGESVPRPFPGGIHLGVILTASAGILNLLLASSAHHEARRQGRASIEGAAPNPGLMVLAGWILPGAGHFMQGRKARAVAAFLCIASLFVLGTYLAEGSNLDRTRHFYYWAGQTFLGPMAFGAELIHGHPLMTATPAYADGGVVLASIAGMLNVMLLLDVYGYSDARLFGEAVASEGDASGSHEPAQGEPVQLQTAGEDAQ